jgi:hypothetical protein
MPETAVGLYPDTLAREVFPFCFWVWDNRGALVVYGLGDDGPVCRILRPGAMERLCVTPT